MYFYFYSAKVHVYFKCFVSVKAVRAVLTRCMSSRMYKSTHVLQEVRSKTVQLCTQTKRTIKVHKPCFSNLYFVCFEATSHSDLIFPVATLLFGTGEQAVRHLFSRNTHLQFTYAALFTCLAYYYIVACWSTGTAMSTGLVVPML